MGKLFTILETFCGIALVACGIEILVSNLKAYALSKPPQPEIPNHVLMKPTLKDQMLLPGHLNLVPATVRTDEQGALMVKGLDWYLEQLTPILSPGESLVIEDPDTKHKYLFRRVK